jgi:hypothetical protein
MQRCGAHASISVAVAPSPYCSASAEGPEGCRILHLPPRPAVESAVRVCVAAMSAACCWVRLQPRLPAPAAPTAPLRALALDAGAAWPTQAHGRGCSAPHKHAGAVGVAARRCARCRSRCRALQRCRCSVPSAALRVRLRARGAATTPRRCSAAELGQDEGESAWGASASVPLRRSGPSALLALHRTCGAVLLLRLSLRSECRTRLRAMLRSAWLALQPSRSGAVPLPRAVDAGACAAMPRLICTRARKRA